MPISQSLRSMADGSLAIAINVPFILPPLPTPGVLTRAPNLLGLQVAQNSSGGSLAGGHNYYYYLTAIDQFGDESATSIPLEAVVPSGTNTNQVELLGNNFLFDRNAVKFNVYRATDNPYLPLLISSGNLIPTGAAFSWTDTGLATSNVIAPSGSLSKCRVYWRVKGTALWHLGAESQPVFDVLETFIGSALDASWTITEGAFAVSGGAASISAVGGDTRAAAVWTSNQFGVDQWAQAVVSATGNAIGLAVRASSSSETFYGFYCDGTNAILFKNIAGSITSLSSVAHATSVGDVLYLSVQGTNLTAKVNGSTLLTASDSSIASGNPGIQGLNTSGGSLKLFQAGNLITNLTFDVPLTLGGDTLDIQLRSVDGQGNETSPEFAPTTNYTVTAPPPTIQLPAHLSYVPESNPLTGHDAGSTATINIASFTMLVAGIPISVNGGSISGLAYNTLYYVYYSDPDLAGGAVTYQDSTVKGDALSSPNNFFVGSITTPAAGAPDTSGNGDGGTGAQSGSVFKLFMAETNGPPSIGGNGAVSSQQNQLNADGINFSAYTCSGNGADNFAGQSLISPPGFSTAYSSAVLKILRALPVNSIPTGFNVYTLKYTTNNFASSTTIETVAGGGGTTLAKGFVTVNLPRGLNLSQVAVNFSIGTNSAGSGAVELDVYGAWIELTQ